MSKTNKHTDVYVNEMSAHLRRRHVFNCLLFHYLCYLFVTQNYLLRSSVSSSVTMTLESAQSLARLCSIFSLCCRCVPSSPSLYSNSPGGHSFEMFRFIVSYSSHLFCVSKILLFFGTFSNEHLICKS